MNLLNIWLETPAPGEIVIDDTWYSPGVVGFIATFGVAAAAVFIVFDLVRRIRRVRYRAEISERLDSEQSTPNASSPQTKLARPEPPKKPDRPSIE